MHQNASLHNYLGQLPSGDVVPRQEGAAGVATHQPLASSGLYPRVERRALGHIAKQSRWGIVNGYGKTEHNDLGYLPPGGRITGAEGAVRVAADGTAAKEAPDMVVERGV